MSRLIKVAIVGRPNVGKSALFNAISKKRIAIVDDEEGTTRDRIYQDVDFFGFPFRVIDTGGLSFKSQDLFGSEIRQHVDVALSEADAIIMVVDGKSGVQEIDITLSKQLLRLKKPTVLAVNKIDDARNLYQIEQFAHLGIRPMLPLSAINGLYIAELLEEALAPFKSEIESDSEILLNQEDSTLKIAILGRPNVGKSMLFNALSGEDRSIVSDIAGTTRDSIDTSIQYRGKEYLFIDTAGIRRKHKEKNAVEKFAAVRTKRALERCDLALLLVDATEGVSREDKKIVSAIEEAQKGCIILFNKWDLVKNFRMEHCLKGVEAEIPFLKNCTKLCISAKTKRGLDQVFSSIDHLEESYKKRISTHQLNKSIISAMQTYHPPVIQGKRLRVYYMVQVGEKPPRFILFVNNPNLMDPGYKRYLINHIRKTFDFIGVPLLITLRGKDAKKNPYLHTKSSSINKDLTHLKAFSSEEEEIPEEELSEE